MILRKWLSACILATLLGGGLPSPTIAAPPPCQVDVTPSAGEQPMALDVAIVCSVVGAMTLRANSTAQASFVAKLSDAAGREIQPDGRLWRVAADGTGTARARYRFELDAYLDQIDSDTAGMRRGTTRALLLGGWLLQPLAGEQGLSMAIAVHLPAGQNFAAALAQRDGRYLLEDVPVRFGGLTVFGTFTPMRVPVPTPSFAMPPRTDAFIDLVMLDADYAAARQSYAEWVRQSAQAIATYFDGFSASQTLIVVFPARGAGIQFGRVMPGGGVTVALRAGTGEQASRMYQEWVLIHEMIHTAMPYIDGRGSWLMEGAATYIEPIIRSRVGWKGEDEVWREWIENMPRGLGALAESGLINASGNAGIYWGGALFMLLSDIEIRRASANRLGLEDCLRAILRSGANTTTRIALDQFMARCDAAVGGNAMRDLAARYVYKATPLDLVALWRELGVALVDGQIVYRDDAPLAAIRKVIVRGTRPAVLVPMGPS